MTIRFKPSRLLVTAACAGALLSAPVVAAPVANAACNAGQVADPITGVCWSSSQMGTGISGTGGTCLPGRLGLCLGALQNSYIPGETLQTQRGAGPNRQPGSWP